MKTFLKSYNILDISLKYYWKRYSWNVFQILWKHCFMITGIGQKINICFRQIMFLTQKQLFHQEFFKECFHWKCSLNIPWISGTLQHWGNTKQIFPECCVPTGEVWQNSLFYFFYFFKFLRKVSDFAINPF